MDLLNGRDPGDIIREITLRGDGCAWCGQVVMNLRLPVAGGVNLCAMCMPAAFNNFLVQMPQEDRDRHWAAMMAWYERSGLMGS